MTAKMTLALPFPDYLAIDAEHFSTLKYLDTSPLHYQHARSRGDFDTTALRIGRLTHAAILTPNVKPERPKLFGGGEVVVYEGIRRGKAWKAFQEEHAGERIVTSGEVEKELVAIAEAGAMAEAMREGVRRNPEALELLSVGNPEVSLEWTHARTGVRVKTRPDWIGRELVEVKTTVKFHPRAFAAEFASRLYHVQIAIQAAGIEVCTGEVMPAKMIVAEKSPPWDVAVYAVDDMTIACGAQKFNAWLDTIERCRRTGAWPGVRGGPLALPEWALAQGPSATMGDVSLDDVFGGEGETL